ncbi:MAG: apolipoprotein N-acyltransferase [Candidatus Nanopelagicaceae bacterium]
MIYLKAALAGLLASAAFHPIAFWPALFLGIGLLYSLNRKQTIKKRIAINLVFGLSYQIYSLYWIGTYVGWYAWLALVMMQASFFLVLSFARGALTFASSWIFFEFILRSFPFGGFGWSRIGYALTDSPFNYLYPRIGIVGIAFVVVLAVALLIEHKFKGAAISGVLLITLSLIPVAVTNEGSIRVALIQGGQSEKLDNTFENAEAAISKHFVATKKVPSESVDLVIWPENAVMHDPYIRRATREAFQAEVERIKAPILVNANLKDGTNGSVLLGDSNDQTYSKRYLTPFGEFIPFRSLVEKINSKAKKVSGYVPGTEPYLFRTENGTFRTLICYELLSDKQARTEMADADFIVTQTNNATYFQTWQLEQELAIAKARSAETSRHSAYVSTTGGTSLINERGQIERNIPKYENQILIGDVATRTGSTPATKYGSLIEYLILALGLTLLVSRRAFRR